jgi:hypothetical protein
LALAGATPMIAAHRPTTIVKIRKRIAGFLPRQDDVRDVVPIPVSA